MFCIYFKFYIQIIYHIQSEHYIVCIILILCCGHS